MQEKLFGGVRGADPNGSLRETWWGQCVTPYSTELAHGQLAAGEVITGRVTESVTAMPVSLDRSHCLQHLLVSRHRLCVVRSLGSALCHRAGPPLSSGGSRCCG